jgi:hypothetical protein
MSSSKDKQRELLGDESVHYDEWKRRLDLESAAYGEAGDEFVAGERIKIEAEKPIKTLIRHELVRATPDSIPELVEVAWTASDDAQLQTRHDKWEARRSRLLEQRGKLLTLLEESITHQLSKDLLTLKAPQMDKIIRERDTLGYLALIRTQSLELSTKSKAQLKKKWEALH